MHACTRLALATLCLPPVLRSQSPPRAADSAAAVVVARYVAARGGMERILAIRTLITRSSRAEGDAPLHPGAVLTRARPYYVLVGDPATKSNQRYAEGSDGSPWEYYPDVGLTLRVSGAPAASLRHTAYFDDPLVTSAREPGWTVTLRGTEVIAGKPAWRLHVVYPDEFEGDFFVDTASSLLVAKRSAAPVHAFGAPVPSQTLVGGYERVNGVLFPTQITEQEIATGHVLERVVTTSIEANVTLPPDTFTPPIPDATPLSRMLNAAYLARAIPTDALGWYADFRRDPANRGADTEPGMAAVGYQILKTGATATAILLLQANAADNPASAEAHFGLGRAYDAAGHTTDAIAEYRAALRADPAFRRAADALARIDRPTPASR